MGGDPPDSKAVQGSLAEGPLRLWVTLDKSMNGLCLSFPAGGVKDS